MLTAIALAATYLAVNLALMVWIERERSHEREIPWQLGLLAGALRYGPPLTGTIYLLMISGDWVFVLFVLAFFAIAAWLMNGLLAYTSYGPDGRRDRHRHGR